MGIIKEGVLPFTFEYLSIHNDVYLHFSNCTFTKNFGKIKKCTYFDWVGVAFGCGKIVCGNDKSDKEIKDSMIEPFKISHSA